MENLRVLLLFLVLAIIMLSSYAQASKNPSAGELDNSALTSRESEHPPQWDASVKATWLPDSGLEGNNGDISMEEIEAGFGRGFSVNSRLQISTGLDYSLLNIHAPDSARLPETLHAMSVSVGGRYRATEEFSLALKVSPGLSSDFKDIDKDDFRMKVRLLARYQIFSRLTLIGGVACTAGVNDFRVHPIAGALYQPSERWSFALGFPRTAVVFSPSKKTQYYIEGMFSGGEYHLHDTSLSADTINYSDYRLIAGVEFPLSRSVKLGVSGGYAFAREFDFDDGNREDVDVDGTPFGRLEVKMEW
jgi:hypothetical protein